MRGYEMKHGEEAAREEILERNSKFAIQFYIPDLFTSNFFTFTRPHAEEMQRKAKT